MNECDLSMDDCDRNALCEDTIGSFNCTCNYGYDGNGTSCSKLKVLPWMHKETTKACNFHRLLEW